MEKTKYQKLIFILRSGKEIIVECQQCNISRNIDGSLDSYKLINIKTKKGCNYPFFININDISAIIQKITEN